MSGKGKKGRGKEAGWKEERNQTPTPTKVITGITPSEADKKRPILRLQ
jgi:hypothetical protein